MNVNEFFMLFILIYVLALFVGTCLTSIICTSYCYDITIINSILITFCHDIHNRKRKKRLKRIVPTTSQYCCKRKMCVIYHGRVYHDYDTLCFNKYYYYFIQFDDITRRYKKSNLKCNICLTEPRMINIPKERKILNTQLYGCRVENCNNFVCFECIKDNKLKNIPLYYIDVIIKH